MTAETPFTKIFDLTKADVSEDRSETTRSVWSDHDLCLLTMALRWSTIAESFKCAMPIESRCIIKTTGIRFLKLIAYPHVCRSIIIYKNCLSYKYLRSV